MSALSQAVQLLGSSCVLSAYVLSLTGRLGGRSVTYLVANLVGSGVLALDACVERQWGFVLLEGVWALVSGAQLLPRHGGAAVVPPL